MSNAGGGTSISSDIAERLDKYKINYKDSDGNHNKNLTNRELISYIQKNFDKKFELDTKKYPLNKTDTIVFLLDFIDIKTYIENVKKNKNKNDDDDDVNYGDSNDNESIEKKEKNNKIIVGLAVKPSDKPNSKGYLMNDFNAFTVYNS